LWTHLGQQALLLQLLLVQRVLLLLLLLLVQHLQLQLLLCVLGAHKVVHVLRTGP
jgi:hypothetical protein